MTKMQKPMFAKLRRRVADFILGNQTVMFTSRANLDRMECGDYLALPDDVLGVATRRWFAAIEEAHRRAADKERRPVSTMTSQHAALSLATMAARANAETLEINIRGSIDGGKTDRIFRVVVTFPEEHDFGPLGVQMETDPADSDKITKLSLGFRNPAYDDWKRERAREEVA